MNKKSKEVEEVTGKEKDVPKTKIHAKLLDSVFEFKFDGQKFLHYWDKKSGMWREDGIQVMSKKMGFHYTSRARKEIIEYLKTINYESDLEFDSKKDILPLVSGVIELSSMKFRKHQSDDMISYVLPLIYNENAVSEYIIPFIEKTVTDENERWNLYAMIGYCFIRSTPYKAIFWILGETNTGKSTFLEILRKFYGKLVSSVSVYDFDKAEYLEGLRGKMVNIEDELSGHKLSPSVINSLKWLSGTEISKQGKKMYINPREIDVKPKSIMASNHYAPPKYEDEAYTKRCIFINFEHQFELTNKDNIIEKMTSKSELSALLNVALQHLKELHDRGKFKKTNSPIDVKKLVNDYHKKVIKQEVSI